MKSFLLPFQIFCLFYADSSDIVTLLILVFYWMMQINEKENELNRALEVDIKRRDRSIEEMAIEADEYKKFVF